MEASPSKCTINSTQYSVQSVAGPESQTIQVTVFSAVSLLTDCFPCDLFSMGTSTILCIPRMDKLKCLVISLTPSKVIFSHLLCGVIATQDHLLASVQFADVSLPISAALNASEEREDAFIESVVSNGENLVAVAVGGEVWQWCHHTNTFALLELKLPPGLVLQQAQLLDGMLVWVQLSSIHYASLTSNSLYKLTPSIELTVVDRCYGEKTGNGKDVLLLSEDLFVHSLHKLMSLPDANTKIVTHHEKVESTTPTSMEAVNEELQAIFSQVCYSPHLIPQSLEQLDPDPTPFNSLMANVFEEHEEKMVKLKESSHFSVSVTVEEVINTLASVTSDTIQQVLATLTHYADTVKLTCLNAFNRFLIMADPTAELDHWRLLFTTSNAKTSLTPLATLYLYLIWQLDPASIVNSLLMVGCKYKECMSTGSAPTSLVDALLDIVDRSAQVKLDKPRLLLYSQLCMLSSSEDRVIGAMRLLKEANIDIDALVHKYGKSSPLRLQLVNQLLGYSLVHSS
ncbi:uncharacterized protein [Watersipora subatra]